MWCSIAEDRDLVLRWFLQRVLLHRLWLVHHRDLVGLFLMGSSGPGFCVRMVLRLLLENDFWLSILTVVIVVCASSWHVKRLIHILAQLSHIETLFQMGVLITIIYVLVILTWVVVIIRHPTLFPHHDFVPLREVLVGFWHLGTVIRPNSHIQFLHSVLRFLSLLLLWNKLWTFNSTKGKFSSMESIIEFSILVLFLTSLWICLFLFVFDLRIPLPKRNFILWIF